MKKMIVPTLTLVFVAVFSLNVSVAEEGKKKPEGKKPQNRAQIFERLDKNNDNSISQEEFMSRGKKTPTGEMKQRMEKIFSRIDKDGNGSLSKQEFMSAEPPKGKKPGQAKKPGEGKKKKPE